MDRSSSSSEAIYGLNPSRLVDLLRELGAPDYRSKQILRWVYQERCTDPQKTEDRKSVV